MERSSKTTTSSKKNPKWVFFNNIRSFFNASNKRQITIAIIANLVVGVIILIMGMFISKPDDRDLNATVRQDDHSNTTSIDAKRQNSDNSNNHRNSTTNNNSAHTSIYNQKSSNVNTNGSFISKISMSIDGHKKLNADIKDIPKLPDSINKSQKKNTSSFG